MKIFIPSNEANIAYLKQGFCFKPLIIDAYLYHLDARGFENTQNRLSKKVKNGTTTNKKGKT